MNMRAFLKVASALLLSCSSVTIHASFNQGTNYDIIGLGSAFIDYIVKVNEEELSEMKCSKGSQDFIEYDSLQSLIKKHDKVQVPSAGGSGANVIKGLAKLGQKCAVLGKIGSDEHALFYLKCLQNLDVTPLLHQGVLPTGQAICFITPDGEGTIRSYKGSSHDVTEVQIDPKIFHHIKLVHMEAYQLQNPALVRQALEAASKQEAKISLDLSSVNMVQLYKDELLNILPKYVDIIFANEAEAFELTHLAPQEACDFLATFCEVAVITMGDKGCWVKSNPIKFYTPALNVKVVDTTGAGDLFASGFLYGYLNHASLPACAELGAYIASKVVQHYGSDIPDEEWKEIYCFLERHASKSLALKSL